MRRTFMMAVRHDLLAVVNHYNQLFALKLTAAQKADLVEFPKSLRRLSLVFSADFVHDRGHGTPLACDSAVLGRPGQLLMS